ncbi:hypothetical protein CONCODRAFT_101540 [Conidiobolus coronatus NRRL 28638]|uniref:CCHC-type domain-containing protein n=1 Tax=Conidiobolus coronatus (strain ATCC 28846 / CBS 209.66 / NRRL 28638) TaxID=796925 RepID=A0A137PFP6_CONC2|nr:hypothetical protein CONCODRAFT_101540 [Conidiobolus coronatus NRRL 28638]|eukprot:KXN73761.1 hypothetical protein CONCODRAFT_101540 [Conidiobolus coronatus NRRL 28638]
MDDYDLEDQLYQEFSDENGSIDSDLEEQAKSYLYHSVSAVAKPLENKFKSFNETKKNINGDSKANSGIQNEESIKSASNLPKKSDTEGQDAESESSSNSDSDTGSVEYETDIEDEEDPPTLELTNEAPETLAMDTELDAMMMDSNIENDRYFGNDKKCRNCGEVGHIAKNCNTRYCFICQSTEHIVSDCTMFHVHGREMFNHIPRGMRSDILSRCSVCDSESHSLRSCTKLWKEYTYNPLSKVN